MIKVRHGKGGEREIVVRWNAKGLMTAMYEAELLFSEPPKGYRGESMTVAKQRNTRGQRLDVTVVYYHIHMAFQPLDVEALPAILEAMLEERGEAAEVDGLHRAQSLEEDASLEVEHHRGWIRWRTAFKGSP